MRRLLVNTPMIISCAAIICFASLILSIFQNDVEWFQASGALVTIGGVLLAARKVLRLGIREFMKDERNLDGGGFVPTDEEREQTQQFRLDIKAYGWSVGLLVTGTVIWAYGGIILRFLGVGAK